MFAYVEGEKQKAMEQELKGPYQRFAPWVHLNGGVLWYRDELSDGEVLTDAVLIPKSMRQRVMRAIHYDPIMAHPSYAPFIHAVRERCFWPKMKRDVKNFYRD